MEEKRFTGTVTHISNKRTTANRLSRFNWSKVIRLHLEEREKATDPESQA